MTTRPFTGSFYLTGGYAQSRGGEIRFSAATQCSGGYCDRNLAPAPATPTRVATPSTADEYTLDPTKIYAARREAGEVARRSRSQISKPTADNIFSAATADVIYQQRILHHG